MKILANDGISAAGKEKLEELGYTVITDKIEQANLAEEINNQDIAALLVRSATTARKELIDACPNLKFIGRGGVGMDNIDVAYAREKGVIVCNTPAASSQSVAELVMGQIFSLARGTYDSNKQMASGGDFKSLKKKYGKGVELRGKTLGIIGFGKIGKSLSEYALGCGMKVVCFNRSVKDTTVKFTIEGFGEVSVKLEQLSLDELLKRSDVVSLHVPKQNDGKAIIAAAEFAKLKDGVLLVNAARGGVIDENELIKALDSGKVKAAALDVFENEPTPNERLLKHEKIALSPHIGAATEEAQERIGLELADLIAENLPIT